jgi:hypothetical protein
MPMAFPGNKAGTTAVFQGGRVGIYRRAVRAGGEGTGRRRFTRFFPSGNPIDRRDLRENAVMGAQIVAGKEGVNEKQVRHAHKISFLARLQEKSYKFCAMSKWTPAINAAKILAQIFGGWWTVMSGAISIPLGALALFTHGSPRLWFGVLAFVGLWGVVIGIARKNYLLLEQRKPKFKIACSSDISACSVYTAGQTHRFFRLQVRGEGTNEILGCVGHLTAISKGSLIFDHESWDLPFAPSTAPDAFSKTFFPNNPYHLDVLMIDAHANKICIATQGGYFPKDKNGDYLFKDAGEYILTVSVSGQQVTTAEIKLKFTWTGNCKTSALEAA